MMNFINQKPIETLESRKQRITNELYQKVKQAIEEINEVRIRTAAETVAGTDEIMNIILKNVPNFKDRLNLQLSCKHFYSLCDNGRSYLPHFEYETDTREIGSVQNYNDEFISFLDGTALFSIPFINDIIIKKLNDSKSKIETFLSRANVLVINRMPNKYFNIFDGIENFKNIKKLSLTIEYLNSETVKFFKILSNLSPHTLYLTILNGERELNFQSLITTNDLKISKTIKHLYYQRGRHFLEVVLHLMRCCTPNQLETLQFPHIGKPNNKNEESLLYKFLPYAKSVRFNESISRHDYSSQHFSDFFSGTRIFNEPNVSLTYQVNIRFSDAEFGRYYERLARNNLLVDEQNNHENTNAGYMSITDLCLGNIIFYDDTSKLTDEEALAFTSDILRMKNLRSLQIRFFTFSTSNHFYYLCKGLNRNLENIKLEKCSGMSIGDVEEIAKNCKYIKNLVLEDITSETISLNKITSLFKHLVGLRLKFNSCYNAAKIINDIKRIDEDGNFKIAWPPLQFLHIHCAYPKTNQRYILRKMAKNTPRRCGQFLFDYLKPSTYEKEYILRIIIQSNTSTCTKFKDSFAKTYLLG